MGRPRQVSDERILEAMRSAVLTHGAAVSLDVVAGRLDISGPALLKRFGNRRSLMLAALSPSDHPEWVQSLEAGPTRAPLQTQLRQLFQSMSVFMEEAVPCFSALRESGIPPQEVYREGRHNPLRGLKALQSWLRAARKRGLVTIEETEPVAFAILGAVQSRAFVSHIQQLSFSERAKRQYIGELAKFFSRALSP